MRPEGEKTACGRGAGAAIGGGAGASATLGASFKAANLVCKFCTLRDNESILLVSFFFSFSILDIESITEVTYGRREYSLDEFVVVVFNLQTLGTEEFLIFRILLP